LQQPPLNLHRLKPTSLHEYRGGSVCFYVLVIVFGTTDLDLLIGKGVKLPIVDVEVPIVGFYLSAPMLIVLVHFNLLLQLQIFSRKLYALDDRLLQSKDKRTTPSLLKQRRSYERLETSEIDNRDLLHIFPCTFYLIGHTQGLILRCLSVVVGTTLVVLPLATLLALQLRFLAYQSPTMTWIQRLAVWFDVAVIGALWPVIMTRYEKPSIYLSSIAEALRLEWKKTVCWLPICASFLIALFTENGHVFVYAMPIGVVASLCCSAYVGAIAARRTSRPGQSSSFNHSDATIPGPVKGMSAFLLGTTLGFVLPLAFVTDGESLETSFIGKTALGSALGFRSLNLREEPLFARPVTPEILSTLRGYDLGERMKSVAKVHRINLAHRSLRHANFSNAVLSGADFQFADLERADFFGAHIEGAQFNFARLERASLQSSNAEGADFSYAHLRGASLNWSSLELSQFSHAEMEAADLYSAKLTGADMEYAKLSGAYLEGANLKGANLRGTVLTGAFLQDAQLFGASFDQSGTTLINVRGAKWESFSDRELSEARIIRLAMQSGAYRTISRFNATDIAVAHPIFQSCITDCATLRQFGCKVSWQFDERAPYEKILHESLGRMACDSSPVASAMISNTQFKSRRRDEWLGKDFRHYLIALFEGGDCPGFKGLSSYDKSRLRQLDVSEIQERSSK
jgi:uncharacterized protein YjbI with pentapeptide repeats